MMVWIEDWINKLFKLSNANLTHFVALFDPRKRYQVFGGYGVKVALATNIDDNS